MAGNDYRPRLMKFILVTLLVIIVGIGIAVLLLSPQNTSLTAQEKKQALAKLLGRSPILSEKVRNTSLVPYNGTYISLSYPVGAIKYPYDENVDKTNLVLENFQFRETEPRYHFVVQVKNRMDALSYDDIPSVSLRRSEKDLYKEGSLKTSQGTWITFIKTNEGFEKTAFLLQNGKQFNCSIIGSDPAIEKIFNQVVESIKIK